MVLSLENDYFFIWLIDGTLAVKVGQGVMAIEGYSTFPKAKGLELYYEMV